MNKVKTKGKQVKNGIAQKKKKRMESLSGPPAHLQGPGGTAENGSEALGQLCHQSSQLEGGMQETFLAHPGWEDEWACTGLCRVFQLEGPVYARPGRVSVLSLGTYKNVALFPGYGTIRQGLEGRGMNGAPAR